MHPSIDFVLRTATRHQCHRDANKSITRHSAATSTLLLEPCGVLAAYGFCTAPWATQQDCVDTSSTKHTVYILAQIEIFAKMIFLRYRHLRRQEQVQAALNGVLHLPASPHPLAITNLRPSLTRRYIMRTILSTTSLQQKQEWAWKSGKPRDLLVKVECERL